ncbi:NHLP bacteriocin export ABC transporter permease/ATPase subunit [Tenacibaculum ovolyticum]|uniref:NHLP bacteriocin export ABC transporter permease/ATPase subunit n=1 Tax=Tenacibaculum ovolyticum TaxID=104270 RepID=UPI0022F3FFC1|nr:NHLP bacteriocin export ABC transporter permease/ATPase subunit [Tenacibaculum ovolyticum]WBX76778.1 NHLP bacteriocin export ABC transporter permease/ATPase subunit [Tenacibaculum ovolyticum]
MFENEKIKLAPNKSLILKDYDRFWMITSGEVDVFYVKIDVNGEYKSTLQYLYSAKRGELLFSLLISEEDKKENFKLLVVSKGASLVAVNKNKLFDIDHLLLKNMIDKWIVKSTNKIQKTSIPRVYTSIDSYKKFSLKKGATGYPTKGIVWCRVNKGKVSKYAKKDSESLNSEFDYPFAVYNNLWVKALSNDVELEAFSTRDVLKDEIFFMLSLNDLQTHLFTTLIKNDEFLKEEEKKRITEKVKEEEASLTKTLSQLRTIVMGKKGKEIQSFSNNYNNDLFATCQLIGDAVGFKFEVPKFMESYKNSTKNQLYAIAQSSKVRVRKIILRGTWWKEENGHLLAFYKEDKRAVALIQKTPNTYVLKDVLTGKENVVNYKIAEELEPICYMFFYGFNGAMTSVRKIGNFAIQGIKKDSKLLILAALAGSLIGLLVPILSGVMFDDVIPTADKSLHFEVFIIMLMLGVVSAGLQLIQGVLQLRVETKSSINLQAGVMDHLLRLPVTFYKKFTAGDLTNRALSINGIRQILSSTVMTAVLSGAFSFVNLGLLFYYDSSLAWIGIGLALIAVVFMTIIGWMKLKYDRQISDVQGELQGFLFEFLSGITKIRITGGERRIFTLWATRFSKLKQLGFSSGSYQNFVETFNSSYPLVTNIFFFAFIYYTVTNSSAVGAMISVGAFMAFISAFNQFLRDCLKMSMALITSLSIITLYERVQPILEETPESSEQSTDPGELAGKIEMNSISFRYQEEQPLVLNDLSFKINQGEMVAFVGTSGSGKSTIMRLLLGFESPEAGSIYYDGDAYDSMNKDLVRRQIGVVLQNGALMSGSIYQNIVGNSELTLEDAWEAARMAGMEEDIKQMPMEMHTVISEGAGTFSGGQRQRLMIARAIVHKPRLLFMDEATSALDNKTQNIVSESLDKLQATRIVIAHRLSTVKNADRIYVLDKGAIVEFGSYDELMKKEGVFSKLAKRQIA